VRSVAGAVMAVLPRVGRVSYNSWTDGWRDREHDRRSAEAEAAVGILSSCILADLIRGRWRLRRCRLPSAVVGAVS
jgi:hypothetical protein